MKDTNSVVTVFPLGRSLELEKDKDMEENKEHILKEVIHRLNVLEHHNQHVHQRLDQLLKLLNDNEQHTEKLLTESAELRQ